MYVDYSCASLALLLLRAFTGNAAYVGDIDEADVDGVVGMVPLAIAAAVAAARIRAIGKLSNESTAILTPTQHNTVECIHTTHRHGRK
jgi:hypothetical protein